MGHGRRERAVPILHRAVTSHAATASRGPRGRARGGPSRGRRGQPSLAARDPRQMLRQPSITQAARWPFACGGEAGPAAGPAETKLPRRGPPSAEAERPPPGPRRPREPSLGLKMVTLSTSAASIFLRGEVGGAITAAMCFLHELAVGDDGVQRLREAFARGGGWPRSLRRPLPRTAAGQAARPCCSGHASRRPTALGIAPPMGAFAPPRCTPCAWAPYACSPTTPPPWPPGQCDVAPSGGCSKSQTARLCRGLSAATSMPTRSSQSKFCNIRGTRLWSSPGQSEQPP